MGPGWTLLRAGAGEVATRKRTSTSGCLTLMPLPTCMGNNPYNKHERILMNSVSERWSMPASPQSYFQQLVAWPKKQKLSTRDLPPSLLRVGAGEVATRKRTSTSGCLTLMPLPTWVTIHTTRIKKNAYEQRVREVEHASFTPIVYLQQLVAWPKKQKLSTRGIITTTPHWHGWIRCRLCFSLLRSAIRCIRGTRSRCGHALKSPESLVLVRAESGINPTDF